MAHGAKKGKEGRKGGGSTKVKKERKRFESERGRIPFSPEKGGRKSKTPSKGVFGEQKKKKKKKKPKKRERIDHSIYL